MGLLDKFRSWFSPGTSTPSVSMSPATVEQARKIYGGIQPRTTSITKAYLDDIEAAQRAADGGDLSLAARLAQAAQGDPRVRGILSTRTNGCVGLPRKFRGNPDVIAALESTVEYARAEFDELAPRSELALLCADRLLLGVGIGELYQAPGAPFPVLTRLDPQVLRYKHQGNVWIYQSVAGPIEITPGDGRWVLHAGGRYQPWQSGLWPAIASAWLAKSHARLGKGNFEATLANAARIGKTPPGANDQDIDDFMEDVKSWALDSVYVLPPGFGLDILEAKGVGYEAFDTTIAQANEDITVCLAGQLVSTTGGTGFTSTNLHEAIRDDLIKSTSDELADTINKQILPAYTLARFGEAYLDNTSLPAIEFDTAKPTDRTREAASLVTTAQAISQLTEALSLHGKSLNIDALCAQFGIPLRGPTEGERPTLTVLNGGQE